MRKHILFIALAAVVASCANREEDILDQPMEGVEFYASFEQPEDADTKVYANEDFHLRWNEDDRVSIFNKITYNQQYRFTGETGDDSGGFARVDGEEFVTGNPIPDVVSVYPYQESMEVSENEVISLTLPAQQKYAENSFGPGSNTMVSVTSDNVLLYKNACGYLRFRLYGEGVSVSSITLKGNNGEKLAGKATITMPLDGIPSLEMASDAATEIKLICDTPVALGATPEESKEFWLVVPPVTFDEGFTISVQEKRGEYKKSTSHSVNIERNRLSKMSPIEVDAFIPFVDERVKAICVENWDTNGDGEFSFKEAAAVTTIHTVFAVSLDLWFTELQYFTGLSTIDPHAFEGCGQNPYLGFLVRIPQQVTSIGSYAFAGCKFYKYYLPDLPANVTIIDRSAFEECVLDSIHVPGNVKRIGERAFADCRVMYSIYLEDGVEIIGEEAFFHCLIGNDSRLSLVLPSSVRSIGARAFLGCKNLPFIEVKATTPPAGGQGMFDDTNDCPIYVPAGSVELYLAAEYWKDYADRIRPKYYGKTPAAVDIGLPVKWASFNLGASSPENYGDCYAWGELISKSDYDWSTYKWGTSNTSLTKYNLSPSYGEVDDKVTLDPEDDVASVCLGGHWRMPTQEEFDALMALKDNPNYTWDPWSPALDSRGNAINDANGNPIYGLKITQKSTGKSIYLPAADSKGVTDGQVGSYWSSSVSQSLPYQAFGLRFNSEGAGRVASDRCRGFSVRPVYAIAVESISLDKTSVELWAGETITLQATVTPEDASYRQVVWSSSDETVATVSANGTVKSISPGTSVISATTADGKMSATCTVTVKKAVPEAVDLGLSVKWASFNLGAWKPEGYGGYYAWGETEPKDDYSWSTYKWCNGSETSLTKYNTNSSYGFVDNKTVLDLEDDAAHVELGDKWRMPTKEEWWELLHNCTWEWVRINGEYCRKFTSNKVGYSDKWIFLPQGEGWSSSISLGYEPFAYSYPNDSNNSVGLDFRYNGHSIRPVYGDPFIPVESISLDKTDVGIKVGESVTLNATIFPENASIKQVIWSSSDESVATVSSAGVVQGVSSGTANIRVKTTMGWNTVSATCSVTVYGLPEAVDLGLSVKWASFNLGAQKPEDDGDYYAWGETVTKSDYSWSNYKWCEGSEYSLIKYCNNASYGYNGYTDRRTVLESEDDIAHVELGGKWRMPTKGEFEELLSHCSITRESYNGKSGYRFTSKVAGYTNNSVFLPMVGYKGTSVRGYSSQGHYRSSSLYSEIPNRAWELFLTTDDAIVDAYDHIRCFGRSIRPVYGDIPVESLVLNKDNLGLHIGESETLKVTVLPSGAVCGTMTWQSTVPGVATVDQNGRVTAVDEGKTDIVVSAGNVSATCRVTVMRRGGVSGGIEGTGEEDMD